MSSLFQPIISTAKSFQKTSMVFGGILALGYIMGGFTFVEYRDTERCHVDAPQERRICYRDYYRTLTEKHGGKAALRDIEERSTEGNLWNQCHELVHEIGETAGKSGKLLPEIFAEGSAFCRAGYYHGVLAEIVRREGEVPAPEFLAAACDTLPGKGTGTGLYRHCTHGVGHGLMFSTHGDVFDSLLRCKAFPSLSDQKECAGGVFMEHFMADGVEHVSKESSSTPATLCAKTPPEYKDVCYERAGTQFASDNYLTPEKSFSLCSALPVDGKSKEQCVGGIGLIALGEEDLHPHDPSFYCSRGENEKARKTCYHGAITTMGKVAPELGDSRTVVCERILEEQAKKDCLAS